MKISYLLVGLLMFLAMFIMNQMIAECEDEIDTLQERVKSLESDMAERKAKAKAERMLEVAQPAADESNTKSEAIRAFYLVFAGAMADAATAAVSTRQYVQGISNMPVTIPTNSYRIVNGIFVPVE